MGQRKGMTDGDVQKLIETAGICAFRVRKGGMGRGGGYQRMVGGSPAHELYHNEPNRISETKRMSHR